MACLSCQAPTQKTKYCSVACNNRYYRFLMREHRADLLRQWRAKNKATIIARCKTCNIDFASTRKISKDCSTDCYNKRRTIERKNLSPENKQHEKQLSHRRYLIMKGDVNRKLKADLRSRLNRAISGFYKKGSAVKNLGCSIQEFKQYLESKFKSGMTWENRGKRGWHIDHIRPLSSFNLLNPDQLKQACHYTNLQPLWAEDNIRKGAKVWLGQCLK